MDVGGGNAGNGNAGNGNAGNGNAGNGNAGNGNAGNGNAGNGNAGNGNAGNGNAGNPGFHPIFNPDYRMPLDEFFRQLITTTILGPDAQPFQISGCEEKPPGWEEKSQSDK